MGTLTTSPSSGTGDDPNASAGTVIGPVPTYGVVIDRGGDLGGLYADDAGVHVFTEMQGGSPVSADLPAGAGRIAVVGIDGTGAVYGTYTRPDGNGGTSTYSFKDDGGVVTAIAGPNGFAGTVVESVNAAGTVLGTYADAQGDTQAFLKTGGGTAAQITVDNVAPASIVSLAPIDDGGDVAGVYVGADRAQHVFLAADGSPAATETALDGSTVTSLVVNAGALAGTLSDPQGMESAFYASGDSLSPIMPLGGETDVQPIGFDDAGDVVGTLTSSQGSTQSFIAYPQDDGSALDVKAFNFKGSLPDGASLQSTRIIGTDAAGSVFGTYTYLSADGSSYSGGFVYSGGSFATLPSGAAFAHPTGRDSAGDIIATPGDDGTSGTSIDRGGIAAPLTVPGRVRAAVSAGSGSGANGPSPIAPTTDRPDLGGAPTFTTDRPSAPPAAAPLPAAAAPSAPTSLPTFAATAAPAPILVPAGDAVSFFPEVSYAHGAFTLSGTASSPAGIAGVEVTATLSGGRVEDLGAAALNPDGSFSFSARIGRRVLSFITATATDRAGGTASAASTSALTGGLDRDGVVAQQDVYTADGGALLATSQFTPGGDRVTTVYAPGQVFTSDGADLFDDGRFGDNTFVFDPGHGASTVDAFRLIGAHHDTLSFSGADFGGSVARLLRGSADAPDGGGVVITDPTTRDTVELIGFSKRQLVANRGDIAFHA